MDAGQLDGGQLSFEVNSEEAEKVIEEASTIVEQRMRVKFPDVPEESRELRRGAGLGHHGFMN